MKRICSIAEIVFLLMGTIVGSGFLSGREIVTFFGKNILVLSVFAGILFFLTSLQLLYAGKKYGNLEKANAALFRKAEKGVNAAVFFCLFAVVSASLAMCDSAFNGMIGVGGGVPVASSVTLLIAFFVARRGIEGVKKLNVFLVPLMLILTVAFLCGRGKFHFGAPTYSSRSSVFGVIFYTGFNMFLSAAVIARAGNTDKTTVIASSAVTALLTVTLILLIYGAINYEGINAADADLPLLYVFSDSALMSAAFGAVLYAGALTTVVCSYYPLSEIAKTGFGPRGSILAAVCVFVVSRLGVKPIVRWVYPAAGILGALYFIALFIAQAYKKGKMGNIKNKRSEKEKTDVEEKKKEYSETVRC